MPLRALVAQGKTFLAVEPVDTLVVDLPAFPAKQDVNALIAVADARGGDFSDAHPEDGLVVPLGLVAVRRTV